MTTPGASKSLGPQMSAGWTGVSRRFDELTNVDIEQALAERPLVLVPCGSMEQHGPHLPTGTDFLASLAIAERVAEQLGGLVLPGFQFGVTPIHMGFKGTITMTIDTYQRVLFDMASSLADHGVEEIAFINWHEGNIACISNVASRLTQERKLNVVVAHACYVAEDLFGEELGGLTHGGAIEAAAVAGSQPALVRYDRIDINDDSPGERETDHARRGRSYQTVLRDIGEISASGWYGSVRAIDQSEGEALLKTVADSITTELRKRFERLAELRKGLH